MIPVPFDEIDKTTIEDLVANEVPESKTLEYKRDLTIQKNREKKKDVKEEDGKKEFLADVSAFANASGGHLVFGVDEDDEGLPLSALGVECKNPDETIRQMESIIRDTIAPRIPNVRTKAIPGFERGPVIVMEIPKSWAGPHLSIKNASRFFSRHSKGKFPLDVQEIRDAFAQSSDLARRISEFRADRVAKILADEGPRTLHDRPKMILHLVPYSSMGLHELIDVRTMSAALQGFRLFDYRGYDDRINLDGRLVYYGGAEGRPCVGYAQIYRSGIIEAADSACVSPEYVDNYLSAGMGKIPVIFPIQFENPLITLTNSCLRVLAHLSVGPPIACFLTLTGVLDAFFLRDSESKSNVPFFYDRYGVDRDRLLLPEVIIQDFKEDAATLLRPIFDAMWQASGNSRCPHYDEKGKRLS